MAAELDKSTSPGNRGSHHDKGSDFLYYVNEADGQVWRQPVNPATQLVQQAPKALGSLQAQNLNSIGASDLRWAAGATKQVQALNGAKVSKLAGFTSLDQISPKSLEDVPWASAGTTAGPEDGLSSTGNFYAVRIPVSGGDQHYAKVRIFNDGATKIEWVTYVIGSMPTLIHTLSGLTAPRDIIMNASETELYLAGGSGIDSYVVSTVRISSGPLPQYSTNYYPLYTVGDPPLFHDPQQMVTDDLSIFVVAKSPDALSPSNGGLFLLQLGGGPETQVQVVKGIANPVGLLLHQDKTSAIAYISDAEGKVYVVDISQFRAPAFDAISGAVLTPSSSPLDVPDATPELALGGPSGFLTWTDDTHTAFYATIVADPGRVVRVDLLAKQVTDELTVADPTLSFPWSVEVFSEGSLSAVCDSEIYDIERGILITADLALGVGLIPFDFITNSKPNPLVPAPLDGRADTSSAPGYYFSSNPNLAFGGNLSLLLNHRAAYNSGLRFYKVSITNDTSGVNKPITNGFTDLRWNPTASPPRFEGVTTGVQSGSYFPVRSPDDLWYNPYLGSIVSTALPDNGYNRLKIEFFDVNKVSVPSASYNRLIYIDNSRSSVTLNNLRRGTATQVPAAGDYQAPEACGLIAYDTKDDLIEFDLTAVHPSGVGKYNLHFYRGSTFLFTVTNDVTATPTLLTVKERRAGVPLRIGHLTGDCDIANIRVALRVPTPGVINGYGWVDLSAWADLYFTLAKPPLTHTNWPTATTPQPTLQAGRVVTSTALVMGPTLTKKK